MATNLRNLFKNQPIFVFVVGKTNTKAEKWGIKKAFKMWILKAL